MNSNFDEFVEAGTKGKQIIMDDPKDETFANWIIDYYKNKGVKFLISEFNGFILIPINNFADYFHITAKYRLKRSGSSRPSKASFLEIKNKLQEEFAEVYFKEIDDKLFIISDNNLSKHRFILNNQEYMLSKKGDHNYYEIRKLSNTFNSNVIFSLKLNDKVHGLTSQEFIEQLKK